MGPAPVSVCGNEGRARAAFHSTSLLRISVEAFTPMNPDWARQLIEPIHLSDGTVLRTLGDAAWRILDLPTSPSAQVAAERIVEAATKGGNMFSTHAAIRLALFKGSTEAKLTQDRASMLPK